MKKISRKQNERNKVIKKNRTKNTLERKNKIYPTDFASVMKKFKIDVVDDNIAEELKAVHGLDAENEINNMFSENGMPK